MELKLYNFSKRANSTKVPADSSAVTKSVTLKENTSLYSPSFLLSGNPTGYNYCKWNDRYYYITDYIYEGRNTFTIACNMDLLATYKSAILATSAFVLYSTSNYDVNIPDTRLSTKNEVDYTTSTATLKDSTNHEMRATDGGYYLVSYAGQPLHTLHPETIAAVSHDGFSTLAGIVNSSSLSEYFATGWFNKMLNNATECIAKVKYIPLPCHQLELYPNELMSGMIIFGGDYATSVRGFVPTVHTYTANISIPWQHSDFRNGARYTNLYCHLPGVGVVELNADLYYGLDSLNVTALVDEKCGDITYDIAGIERFTVNVSRDVHMSAESRNIAGAIASVASGVVAVASGGVSSAVLSAFNVASSTLNRHNSTIGGTGQGYTQYSIDTTLKIESACHNTTIEPSAMASRYGRPCNKVLSLANLTGYCQTTDAHVAANASEEVIDQLNNLLNGGIYIE